MKTLIAAIVLFTINGFSQTPPPPRPNQPNTTPDPKTQALKVKMTSSEAKELCKQEGKSGADLISCMKDKQEAK
jgi:hypothetical protein